MSLSHIDMPQPIIYLLPPFCCIIQTLVNYTIISCLFLINIDAVLESIHNNCMQQSLRINIYFWSVILLIPFSYFLFLVFIYHLYIWKLVFQLYFWEHVLFINHMYPQFSTLQCYIRFCTCSTQSYFSSVWNYTYQ